MTFKDGREQENEMNSGFQAGQRVQVDSFVNGYWNSKYDAVVIRQTPHRVTVEDREGNRKSVLPQNVSKPTRYR